MGRKPRQSGRDKDRQEFDERVLDIKRVAKVVKGGRRFSFRTVVVVGDNRGQVGIGIGKARGVPDSIRKGAEKGRKDMRKIPLIKGTIPHEVEAEYSGAVVMLRPAAPGTGVIAGGAVRAVVEAAGITDILTKSKGSANMLNVAQATLDGLGMLYSPEELAVRRGIDPNKARPFWSRNNG